VTVLWGFLPSTSSAGAYEVDPYFDMRPHAAQQALIDFCERVEQEVGLKVFKTTCWPRDFAQWLRGRNSGFPSTNLKSDIHHFSIHEPALMKGRYGLDAEVGVTWLSMDFRAEFDTHSSGRTTEPYMAAWEEFVDREAERLSTDRGAHSLGTPAASSELFMRAEAELRVVGSALASWLCSVACALVAVAVFTRDAKLSVIATFAIFSTAACSLFAITSIFQWEFGLMEAVSLIIFCGFSVDYPLHVVQAYVQERQQGSGVRKALREVGFAVGSGCLTTCGAAAFLLLCQIRIFTRFGQVLIVNMLFSIVFAVAWIPACLELREMWAKTPPLPGSQAAESHAADAGTGGSPPEGFVELPGSALRA